MKRKYERKPKLSLLLKMKRKEKEVKDRILSDQTAYEDNFFKENGCPTCKIPQIPPQDKTIPRRQKHIPTLRNAIYSMTFSPMSSLSTRGKNSKNKPNQIQNSITLSSPKMKSKKPNVASR